MIFVAGTLTITPDKVAEFETEVAAMRDKVLAEDGCHHYSLLFEDRAGGVVNVLEIWESEDALKVHLKMPWIDTFFHRFSPHITGMTAQLYDAVNARPIPMG